MFQLFSFTLVTICLVSCFHLSLSSSVSAGDFGMRKIVATFENQESAQRFVCCLLILVYCLLFTVYVSQSACLSVSLLRSYLILIASPISL